jgi:SAM-dependent methyltransferase
MLDPRKSEFWESRYVGKVTNWDLYQPAPALLSWLKSSRKQSGKVLVLGCGRGYDAIALAEHGFEVTAIDFAPTAIAAARTLAAEAEVSIRWLQADIFALDASFDGWADVVFEHTFFCTLEPASRPRYRELVSRLVKPGGDLVGVFFTFADDGSEGPPFTIDAGDLPGLLAPEFACTLLAPVPDSVEERKGEEHFAIYRRMA